MSQLPVTGRRNGKAFRKARLPGGSPGRSDHEAARLPGSTPAQDIFQLLGRQTFELHLAGGGGADNRNFRRGQCVDGGNLHIAAYPLKLKDDFSRLRHKSIFNQLWQTNP